MEKLILEGCTSLREIGPSIGDLKRLGLLDLKECKSLGSLPDSICSLKSLKTLYLSGCSKLNCLPKDMGNMEHLTELYANRTATAVPPPSIGHLRKLQILSFSGCKAGRAYPYFLSSLSLLRELDLSDWYWWDAELQGDFRGLYSLKKLNLSGSRVTIVGESITRLPKLKVLVLGRCKWLRGFREFPPSLEELDAHECVSLKTSLASSSDVVEGTSRMSLHKTILKRIQVSLSLSFSLYLSISFFLFISLFLMIFHGRTTLQRVSSVFSFLEMEFLNGLNIRKWDLH